MRYSSVTGRAEKRSAFRRMFAVLLPHPAECAALFRPTYRRVGMLGLLLSVAAGRAAPIEQVRADYMLACQGCHLDDGRGYPERGVPKLTGYLGNFLKVPGGREFLVQVPGSAQSDLSDARLAALLNWMVRSFSPNQVPADFVEYGPAEVGRLRLHPLVTVKTTRAELVKQIDQVMVKQNEGATR